jgi:predicted  nucleic acid-binding Zn-ribbon protein
MSTAAELFALQEIDLALDKALARLAEIEEALHETEELIEARGAVEEKEGVVSELRSRQKDLEWSVEEVRTKASEIEGKLYGGSVRNPKELSDLDADLKSIKSQVSKREDDLLVMLVELDEAEAELSAASAAYAEIETAWKESQGELRREKEEIQPEVERLQASREGELANIDRGTLSLYDALRQRRAGRAVARVERGMCQGCRITLPVSILQKARSGAGLVQCVSCERMLLVS